MQQQKLIELRLLDFKDKSEILKINYLISNKESDNQKMSYQGDQPKKSSDKQLSKFQFIKAL